YGADWLLIGVIVSGDILVRNGWTLARCPIWLQVAAYNLGLGAIVYQWMTSSVAPPFLYYKFLADERRGHRLRAPPRPLATRRMGPLCRDPRAGAVAAAAGRRGAGAAGVADRRDDVAGSDRAMAERRAGSHMEGRRRPLLPDLQAGADRRPETGGDRARVV